MVLYIIPFCKEKGLLGYSPIEKGGNYYIL